MSEKSIYAGVTNVVQLHSHTSKPCTICKKHVDLVDGINHYVNDHD